MDQKYSKNAFNCSRCPQEGCPAWWSTIWTNNATGEQKVFNGCGFTQLPIYLTEVIKAANRPAAAVESTRNEIAEGFRSVSQHLALLSDSRKQIGDSRSDKKRLRRCSHKESDPHGEKKPGNT